MFALRVTPAMLVRAVLILSTCLALVVGGLSLFVRPWANGKLHELSRTGRRAARRRRDGGGLVLPRP